MPHCRGLVHGRQPSSAFGTFSHGCATGEGNCGRYLPTTAFSRAPRGRRCRRRMRVSGQANGHTHFRMSSTISPRRKWQSQNLPSLAKVQPPEPARSRRGGSKSGSCAASGGGWSWRSLAELVIPVMGVLRRERDMMRLRRAAFPEVIQRNSPFRTPTSACPDVIRASSSTPQKRMAGSSPGHDERWKANRTLGKSWMRSSHERLEFLL